MLVLDAIILAEFWCCKRNLKSAGIMTEGNLETLKLIDDWLMDCVFQPFQNWFQRLAGKNCFFLAYVTTFVFLFARLVNGLCHKNPIWIDTPVITIFVALVMAIEVFTIRMDFLAQGGDKILCANHARIDSTHCRNRRVMIFVWLILSPLLLILVIRPTLEHLSFEISFAAFPATHFFVSCTPLPPQRSKIRQWLSQLRAGIKQLFDPVWQPVPVRT